MKEMKNPTKNTNIINVHTSLYAKRDNFFDAWLILMKPYFKLTDTEVALLAMILKVRYDLSKSIIDEDILDRNLFSNETRKYIRSELNMSPTHMQVILSKFRKNGLIVNNRINKKCIPNISHDTEGYKLIFDFKFVDKS